MKTTSKHSDKRTYKYFDLILGGFVTVLLCANLIGVSKITTIFGVTFGAGNLFFPISYLFGDILTEVYGYKKSRKVVWSGFAALAFASFMSFVVVHLPPALGWTGQVHIEAMFGATWRITLASFVGYFCGEFSNSYVLAKMKIWTRGKMLWTRTIGSTVVGEAVDSIIFYPLAFYGVWDNNLLMMVVATNYLIKVLWEIVMTPVTYRVVSFLKRVENEDYYDSDTDFNPFTLKT